MFQSPRLDKTTLRLLHACLCCWEGYGEIDDWSFRHRTSLTVEITNIRSKQTRNSLPRSVFAIDREKLLVVAYGEFSWDGLEVAKEPACAMVGAGGEIELCRR